MATEFVHSALSVTRKAGADVVGRRFNKLDGDGNVVPIAAATDVPYALTLFDVKTGFEVHCIKTGIVKAEASAAIAVGDSLGVSANGRLVKVTLGTDNTKFVVGRAVEAASGAGQIIQVELDLISPRTA